MAFLMLGESVADGGPCQQVESVGQIPLPLFHPAKAITSSGLPKRLARDQQVCSPFPNRPLLGEENLSNTSLPSASPTSTQPTSASPHSADPWAMVLFLLLSMPLLMWLFILLVPLWDYLFPHSEPSSHGETSFPLADHPEGSFPLFGSPVAERGNGSSCDG